MFIYVHVRMYSDEILVTMLFICLLIIVNTYGKKERKKEINVVMPWYSFKCIPELAEDCCATHKWVIGHR